MTLSSFVFHTYYLFIQSQEHLVPIVYLGYTLVRQFSSQLLRHLHSHGRQRDDKQEENYSNSYKGYGDN